MHWDKSDIPHKGWTEVDIIDLGEEAEPGEQIEYETCEMCGNEKIRFVHVLTHPDFNGEMRVGCVCAERMTDDYVNPERRENEVRNRANRKYNFMKQEWYRNAKGNYVLKYKGQFITVVPSRYGAGFGVYYGGQSVWDYKGKKIMDLQTAKLAAFDAFDVE